MGMKKIYSCNICRDEIENPTLMYGVHFSNLTQFTLGGYACTEGVHICFRCAIQLKKHLNCEALSKELAQQQNIESSEQQATNKRFPNG